MIIPHTSKFQLPSSSVRPDISKYHSSAITSSSIETLMSSYYISDANLSNENIFSLISRLKSASQLPVANTSICFLESESKEYKKSLLSYTDSLLHMDADSRSTGISRSSSEYCIPFVVTRGFNAQIYSSEAVKSTQYRLYTHRHVFNPLPIPLRYVFLL